MKLGGYQEASMPAGRQQGFTIVEVMIVLAVTSIMFISALAFINGRQNRTQFSTAINVLQQQMQQIINETNNGYLPQTTSFKCAAALSAPPTLSAQAAGDHQGQNPGCIFLGKVIQFGLGSANAQQYGVVPILGNRLNPSGAAEATTLYGGTTGSLPEAAAAGTTPQTNLGLIGADTTVNLTQGLHVVSMWHDAKTLPANATSAVGFISSLPNADGAGVASGTQHLSLYTVTGATLGMSIAQLADAIYPVGASTPLVPVSSVSICVASGTTNQSGLIVIGQSDNSSAAALGVTLTIMAGTVC